MKSIGIISGAGPYAGIVLHQKIIKLYNALGYKKDAEFPLIKHISYPFNSTDVNGVFNFALSQKELDQAIEMCAGVEKIALACNSLLLSLNEINKNKIFDPRFILRKTYNNDSLIVLASVSSVKSGLYDNISQNIIYPNKEIQTKVNQVIDEVMQGKINHAGFSALIEEVQRETPSSLILLGCTELCVFEDKKSTINILNVIAENMI